MIRSSLPPIDYARTVRGSRLTPSPGLSDLRRKWVGRSVEFAPPGFGADAWLMVRFPGSEETAWVPVGLRTLGELTRAVGAVAGAVPGGRGYAFARPLPFGVLEALEPRLCAALYYDEPFDGYRPELGGFFSSIGDALKKVTDKVKDVAKKAAEAVSKVASKVGKAAGKAAKSAGKAIKKAGKPIMAGALIAGGVALGATGFGLPLAGTLVGAGVGVLTKKGSNLGKFSEWAPRAGIGAAAGLVAGVGAQWIINGGLTSLGSTIFSKASGSTLGTVGTATPQTAATVTAAQAGGGFSWSSLPIGGIIKTGAGFFLKGSGGSALPFTPAPGAAPSDAGMLYSSPAVPQFAPSYASSYEPTEPAAPAPAPSAESGLWGMSPTTLAVAGIGVLAVLVLGMRR